MPLKSLFFIQIEAACVCRESGTSLCNCDPSYVKPKPLPVVRPEQKTICKTYGARELSPIGDLCSCGKVHVEPAQVRTSSSSLTQTSSKSTETKTSYSIKNLFEDSHTFGKEFAGTEYEFAPYDHKPKAKPKAADSTSIILALEEHQRCSHHVPESKLHYGFYGKVKDEFTKHTKQDLLDGYLYKVVGDPISLRRCKQQESHEEVESEEEDDFVPHELGYKEIGYAKHKFNERTFTKHEAAVKSHECKDKVHYVSTKTCGCKR